MYTDGREKIPGNVRAMLFSNPVEMFKMAEDAWEFQSGHADLAFQYLEKEERALHAYYSKELRAKRQATAAMDEESAALEVQVRQLKAEIEEEKARQAREKEAQLWGRMAYPQGSVKSPVMERRSRRNEDPR